MQLLSNYFECLKQQASNDAQICQDTVSACYRGFSIEKAKQLLETEKGTLFLELMTKIISAIVEYCKDSTVLPERVKKSISRPK